MSAPGPSRLDQLQRGTAETRTLGEALAIDLATLLGAVDPRLLAPARARVDPTLGITRRMPLAAGVCRDVLGADAHVELMRHPSDTIRGIACYLVASRFTTLRTRLEAIRPLAADSHFGVREWAWMAVRPAIAADPLGAIALLVPWTTDADENVRRFASEATRPRGVWCASIRLLREQPSLGEPILEPLRADPSRYVQNSVANWINDAAKDRPAWAVQLCERWRGAADSPATAYVLKRALRSIKP